MRVWNSNGILEPITETFPKWGSGGGTQAITDKVIQINIENITELKGE
jgi:hypothetical protein